MLKCPVAPLERHQLFVGAGLPYIARLHIDEKVRIADGGEPVRDHKARPTLTQLGHRFLDQHLGAGVDRTRRLIQNQDGRVQQEGAANRHELALAL